MKNKRILYLLCLILTVGLMTQCEKYGSNGGPQEPDEDSDRPEWAGGNTGSNPHIKGNDDSGTTRGGDFGDLYILLRDEVNGMPVPAEINGEFYVQPIDVDGDPVDLNEEGEVIDVTQVQEVDFGRLNIVRSPTSVLDQALGEALKVLDPEEGDQSEYYIYQDFCGRLVSHYFNVDAGEYVDKTIDSPREAMAIYRSIMQDFPDTDRGDGRLAQVLYIAGLDPLEIAASCFAAGSDKTGFVDVDEVVYINGFMNCYGNPGIISTWEQNFAGDYKKYFDFSGFNCDRENTFNERYIQFLVWNDVYFPDDENGVSQGPVFSVLEIFEGLVDFLGIGEQPQFTYRTGQTDLLTTGVQGFAMAVDDAVQVLDFVHGDSNVRFLPGYEP